MPRVKRHKAAKEVVTEIMDDSQGKGETVEHIEQHTSTQETNADVDMEDCIVVAPYVRPSKFREATMNSTNSIRPPPDEQWAELGIDHLLEGYDQENSARPSLHAARKGMPRTQSTSAVPTASDPELALKREPSAATTREGHFGRISRAVASFFQAASFSSLGKRKAGQDTAETDATADVDRGDAKERAEAAYAEAMARGLLPTPKVFVRPVARARTQGVSPHSTPHGVPATPNAAHLVPRTPTLYKSPSKKDFQKQKKLNKRVSDLEHKLSEARRELAMTLSPEKAPPLPSIPSDIISPPKTDPPPMKRFWHDKSDVPETSPEPAGTNRVIKKRKSRGHSDDEYKPVATDSDFSHEGAGSEHDTKRGKSTPSKLRRKSSTRSVKKGPQVVVEEVASQEDVVIVVPDDRVGVPPIPAIPQNVDGRRALPRRDGYGGFEHEMF
ncbi:unnamed protein product [Periconia digitata]|uniref:Uncharacterized protein n=1 Tax=Periconia digitata TaxID=1303443 RepID=A0A9W4UC44_9PLEO|nr:unnamed protein product [Periconia digitata]